MLLSFSDFKIFNSTKTMDFEFTPLIILQLITLSIILLYFATKFFGIKCKQTRKNIINRLTPRPKNSTPLINNNRLTTRLQQEDVSTMEMNTPAPPAGLPRWAKLVPVPTINNVITYDESSQIEPGSQSIQINKINSEKTTTKKSYDENNVNHNDMIMVHKSTVKESSSDYEGYHGDKTEKQVLNDTLRAYGLL